ncbi:hypothetical protein [Demequina sp. NBRC 110057]|uniref:hypothetical protein n=1 Tax=Demequina sp. NBRC 110057 TaxID=1570346 RepID=UPI0009FCE771|nr:hypothetical protein [Demequina sp. NBRC 110057]
MSPTEYVVVDDPRHHRGAEPVEDERASPRRPWWRLLAVAALAVIALLVGMEAGDGGDARPAPEPTPTPRTLAVDRAAALAYQEWRDRSALVECMAEGGYPYEARIVDNDQDLAGVADYLGVDPAPIDPDAPIPLLRQPDLYLGRGGSETVVATGSVGCDLVRTAVDVASADAVAALVAQARSDRSFLAVLAEQVWVALHPAEVTQRVALLRVDRGEHRAADAAAQARWTATMGVVSGSLRDGTVWAPVTVTTTDTFTQTAGLTASGGALVLRVGERDVPLQVGFVMSRADVIYCGPVAISAAVKTPYGDEGELRDFVGALAGACGALASAGVVEAETLAEVYFE